MTTKAYRVAALIRVSSAKQAGAQKTSLTVQREAIELACKGRLTIAQWYEGVESASKRDRPILNRLLADAKLDLWDGVMVGYEPTRRTRDTEEGAMMRRILAENHKDLWMGPYKMDLRDPEQVMVADFQDAQSQGENRRRRKNVMVNKFKAARGGRYPYRMPWGLEYDDDGNWVKKKGHQAIANRVYDYIVRRGWSLERVAAKVGHGSPQVWRERILNMGIPTLDLEEFATGTRHKIPFPKAPRFYTAAELAAIKKRWDANRTGKHTGGHKYELTPKLKCSCGTTLSGAFRDGRREYRHPNGPLRKDEHCIGAINAEKLEWAVWRDLETYLKHKDLPALILKGGARPTTDYEGLIDVEQGGISAREKERRDLWAFKAKTKDIDEDGIRTFGRMLADLHHKDEEARSRIEQLQREQAEVGVRKDRAQMTADLLAYVAEHPSWWSKENKSTLLDCCFGMGNTKGRDAGILIWKKKLPNGRATYTPEYRFSVDLAQALELIAGSVTPGKIRPRLPPDEEKRAQMLNGFTSTST